MRQRWHILLYDEECAFCKWAVDKVLAWDRRGRIKAVPIQGPVGQQLLADMPEEERLESYHLATPAGRVVSGGAAPAELARLLPGGTPLAGFFLTFPKLTGRAYAWVSNHRSGLVKLLRIDPDYELRRG